MTDRIKYLRRSIKESVPNRIELKCTKGKLPQWLNGTVWFKLYTNQLVPIDQICFVFFVL